jgi:hypothetical protein
VGGLGGEFFFRWPEGKTLSLGSCLHESSKLNAVVFREDTIAVNLRKKDIGKETESHFEQENQEFFKLSVNYCFR